MSSKIALVTGAAGFIGSHLIDRLIATDWSVIGIDNFVRGRRENLGAALATGRCELIELDLSDTPRALSELRKHLRAPIATVWHMAANSDIAAGVADPDVDLRDTFLTTFTTLKLMRELKIPDLHFASSSAIYGDHPIALTEATGPLLPASNYGAMKLASEGAITAAAESFLKRAQIYRFPNVVGSRSTHGVIHDFMQKLKVDRSHLEVLGDGTQEKPYLHVSELIEAMMTADEKDHAKIGLFNVGVDSSATTVRFIAENVVAKVAPGARIDYGKGNRGWVGDVPKFSFDTHKIRSLGWTPQLRSNDTIVRAIQEIATENGML